MSTVELQMSFKQEEFEGNGFSSSDQDANMLNNGKSITAATSSNSVNIINVHQNRSHNQSQITINSEFNNENEPLTSNNLETSGQIVPEQADLKIIRRKISNYVGFANLPKQWHRKSIKRGFNLNLLCVSQSGLGKSTLINTLFNKNIYNDENTTKNASAITSDEKIDSVKLEDDENTSNEVLTNNIKNQLGVKIESISTIIEENGVTLRLTVVDTPGFGDSIDNTDSWDPIIKEINSRFDQYLDSENRINRSTIEDNRIHACLYFIEPTAHFLKPLDLEFCKQVHEKCNLIPIIAKSDILTDDEISQFKRRISNQLDEASIKLFKPPHYDLDDEETLKLTDQLFSKIPFAVVGSTDLVTNSEGKQVRGRSYPWGIVEVDNSDHNDFIYLRDLLIRQYLEELRERTSNELYENYRSFKLTNLGIKQDNSVFKEFDPATRQKEDKQLHEAKLAKLEAEMKSVFQTKVSEKEKKLQKSEAELFTRHKEMKEKLTKQLKALEEKKHQLEMSISNQSTQSPAQKKKGFLR